ncbi:MAG: TIGR04283 family arsenosugar biosynthesis glycosyltransferase [Pseudomonadales bacterium]|nr:TIGR04283 family arsenosugar biosynthesis glycosyltransferase [Pseudomonadales bacterium]MCP5184716.1 TIGR04283 family arsenosugar biosynthesis glycosyltransferase [Pseudomonadales bacterium]
MTLSIIIPVLNDAAGLQVLLEDLGKAAQPDLHVEIVVVDGGSSDASVTVANRAATRVVRTSPGRGQQLAAGVAASTGDVIWFLHADSRVPAEALRLVATTSAPWGRLRLRFQPDSPGLRMVATCMHWRSRLSGICTGDQGMWVRRSVLTCVGGVPTQPLMEDIELSRRLKRVGRPCVLPATLTTSPRRWQRDGLWRTIVSMWWFRLRYFFGAEPGDLAVAYRRPRRPAAGGDPAAARERGVNTEHDDGGCP